jgi:hypothetical protein
MMNGFSMNDFITAVYYMLSLILDNRSRVDDLEKRVADLKAELADMKVCDTCLACEWGSLAVA